MRYIKGEFLDLYNVTVGVEFATKIVTIESGQQVRLQIWDTVTIKQVRPVNNSLERWSDHFIKVFQSCFFCLQSTMP